jgi:sugar phosphate isomerase/epimerase
MPPLSLAALTILDAGPAGQIRACAAAGWTSVGLRLNPLLDTDQRVVGDAAKEREVETLMRETGMALLEVGVFPIKPGLDVAALEPVIAFSAKLGARCLVCPVEDHDLARRRDAFARLCDLATRYRIDALAEFNPYSACRDLAGAVDLVTSVNKANAGLVIDALHLSRSGGHPDDLKSVDPALLRLVHFTDATAFTPGQKSIDELRKESRTARLLPGEGALWLRELLAALPAHCRISVEAPSAKYAHLPASERARIALETTSAFITSAGA